jgi:hypothetical protein
MRGRGDATFEPPITLSALPSGLCAGGILSTNVDADGKLDWAGSGRSVLVLPSVRGRERKEHAR